MVLNFNAPVPRKLAAQARLKSEKLTLEPTFDPNLADADNQPTIRTDFTIPVEGLESPWGMAKLVFFHDAALRGGVRSLPA